MRRNVETSAQEMKFVPTPFKPRFIAQFGNGMTRREWLSLAVAGGLQATAAPFAQTAKSAGRPWGVQLYTVREQIATDPAATLKAIADIGYRELEVLQDTLSTVAPLAKKLGLAMPSIHIDPQFALAEDEAKNAARLAQVIDSAKASGAGYLVMAYIPPDRRPANVAGYQSLGARLNRLGEQVAKGGLHLAYHNHAFEFSTLPSGQRALDVLAAATDPGLVKLEVDVFWVSVAGADPVDLIKKHSSRVTLLHLKDKAPGVGPMLNENVPPSGFAELGSGTVDFPRVLEAGRAVGVEHYFVEQDLAPGNPIDSLRRSLAYLQRIG
jgi:sugar phosphate isomerase/epimerase